MDYREFMAQAPRDLQPKVLTEESMLQDWAQRLGKTTEELTEEERQQCFQNHINVCWTDYDLATS